MNKYVIYNTKDFHIVDVADTLAELNNRSWWRTDVRVASRSWYDKFANVA